MSIGSGIALFVIGAILVFAVNVDIQWVDLDMVGYILMGAGVVIFLIGIVLLARRRRTETVSRTFVDPARGDPPTRRPVRPSGDDAVGGLRMAPDDRGRRTPSLRGAALEMLLDECDASAGASRVREFLDPLPAQVRRFRFLKDEPERDRRVQPERRAPGSIAFGMPP